MSLYLEHFNLRELPFRLTPAIEFFYRGGVRGETLDALMYAINNGEGIISVVGEVGTGKSMLCRKLMTELKDEVELVYIANPSISDLEIIYHIAEELEIDISGNRHQVARSLQNHLLELHQQDKKVLVCIDEAQAMPDESLEQIRLLSNLETSTEKIIQIVMFGQPELADKLNQQHLRQLNERITSAFHLRKLNANEVKDYVNHRIFKASTETRENLFSDSAIKYIAKISQGVSRRINILCDKAMLAAFADNSEYVSLSHAKQAARDARYRKLDYENKQEEKLLKKKDTGQRKKAIFASVAVFLTIAAVAYQVNENNLISPITLIDTEDTNEVAVQEVTQAIQAPPPVEVNNVLTVTNIVRQTVARTVTVVQQTEVTVQRRVTPLEPEPIEVVVATALTNTAVIAIANTQTANIVNNETLPQAPPAQVALVDNQKWRLYPATSYLRQRLNATETLLKLEENPDSYTARILTVPRERAIEIERYIRDLARFFSIRNVMIYPANAEDTDVFVITYGIYPSEFQAELFIHELPSFFKSNKPFTQSIAVSQLEAVNHW